MDNEFGFVRFLKPKRWGTVLTDAGVRTDVCLQSIPDCRTRAAGPAGGGRVVFESGYGRVTAGGGHRKRRCRACGAAEPSDRRGQFAFEVTRQFADRREVE